MEMSELTINKILNLKIKTITPISIGTDKGDVMSPYADFVFSQDGKMLHYLDLQKVENVVDQQQKIDEYVDGIKSGMDNNRSDFNLLRFLTGSLKLDLDEITKNEVQQHGLKPGDKRNINPTIKNAGLPYLPGSTLKGALRTAMLYNWLVYTDEGEKPLLENAGLLNRISKMEPFKKREINAIIEQLFNEDRLLGNLKSPFGPDARFLRVCDSVPLKKSALSVYALRRIRLKPGTGKSAIPQVLEAIPPGHILNTSLNIDPWLKEKANNTTLAYLVDGNFTEMFKHLSTFSTDCIANELYELRDATTRDFEKEVDSLISFYEKLQKRANEGAIFLRLGFGKTVNDNSLTLALANGLKDQTAFNTFRSTVHKLKRDSDLFPITRSITPDGLPMGWVEVTV